MCGLIPRCWAKALAGVRLRASVTVRRLHVGGRGLVAGYRAAQLCELIQREAKCKVSVGWFTIPAPASDPAGWRAS